MIPYGRQYIDEDDVRAVTEALRSDYLTTGPLVEEFEGKVASYCRAGAAVAVSSGTAALHCAMFALGVGPGDEVVVPPMTFAATANCVLYLGGTPVFADVDPDTLLIDPEKAERKITPRTKAIIGVDYAGQPCDWDVLREIADRRGVALVADGCHALGAEYRGRRVGALADMTTFSFHPVKHITTGEGGMVVTDSEKYADKMRRFRNHGISTDHRQRESRSDWRYDMIDLGFNYRITDIQCALGISQMKKLEDFLGRRRAIASAYDEAFGGSGSVRPLKVRNKINHAYHLYVVRVPANGRGEVFSGLREAGVGVNVHYIPVHLHPYYRRELGIGEGQCPKAEACYREIISLPMWPGLSDEEREFVVRVLKRSVAS
jgi:perosamine synthetase